MFDSCATFHYHLFERSLSKFMFTGENVVLKILQLGHGFSSGVPRILEWEGSRCRRCRGGWGVGKGYALPTGGRVWGRACPLPRKFLICWKYGIIILAYWRLLTHFKIIYSNGRGSNLLTPSLVRHWVSDIFILHQNLAVRQTGVCWK